MTVIESQEDPRPSAVVLCGLPGSGKSGWFKQHLFDTHVRISSDMLGSAARERALLDACLSTGQSYALDKCSVRAEDRLAALARARDAGFRTVCVFVDVDAEVALARNALREGAARVPRVAIYTSRKRLVVPTPAEGWDELIHVRPGGAPVVERESEAVRLGSS